MRVRPITDDDKNVHGGIPLDEANRQAAQETAQQFPDGRLSPGHAVLVATDDAGSRIGRLWMAPRGEESAIAFIYEIAVEEAERRRGYGRALMQEAANWARDNGFRSLALHVFGGNDIAINLYESLGFVTTDRTMKLEL